jgi:hypothetical protein
MKRWEKMSHEAGQSGSTPQNRNEPLPRVIMVFVFNKLTTIDD